MKTILATIVTAAILAGGAAAGVPGDIAALVNRVAAVEQTTADQDARIKTLERKVTRLTRQRPHSAPVVCRVIAGQPLPEICR